MKSEEKEIIELSKPLKNAIWLRPIKSDDLKTLSDHIFQTCLPNQRKFIIQYKNVFNCLITNFFFVKREKWIMIPKNKTITSQIFLNCLESLVDNQFLIEKKGVLGANLNSKYLAANKLINLFPYNSTIEDKKVDLNKLGIKTKVWEAIQEREERNKVLSHNPPQNKGDSKGGVPYFNNIKTLQTAYRLKQEKLIKQNFKSMKIEIPDERGNKIIESNLDIERKFITDKNHENKATHGRFYHDLCSLKKETREIITFSDKETTEVDYEANHLQIYYHIKDLSLPEGDLYVLSGQYSYIPRKVFKKLFMFMTSNKSYDAARQAAINAYKRGEFEHSNLFQVTDIKHLMKEFENQHKVVKDLFYTGNEWLMRVDSDIAHKILYEFALIEKPIMPIHDSFVVLLEDKDFLKEMMIKAWQEVLNVSYEPRLKEVSKKPLEAFQEQTYKLVPLY